MGWNEFQWRSPLAMRRRVRAGVSIVVLAMAAGLTGTIASFAYAQAGVRVGNCWTDYAGRNHCGSDPTPPRGRGGSGGTVYYPSPPVLSPAESAYASGSDFFNAGRYAEALPYAQQAATLAPNVPGYLRALGQCYAALGRYAEALTYLDRALALNPGDAKALNEKGFAQFKLGDKAAAVATWKQSMAHGADGHPQTIADNIRNAEAWLGKERADKDRQQVAAHEKAAKDIVASLRATLQQQATRMSLSSKAREMSGTPEGMLAGIELLRGYTRQNPNDGFGHYYLADAYLRYFKLGIPGQPIPPAMAGAALDAARRGYALERNDSSAHVLIGVLVRVGRADEAVATAKKETGSKLVQGGLTIWASEAIKDGKLDAAERLLDLSSKGSPPATLSIYYQELREAQFEAAIRSTNTTKALAALEALDRLKRHPPGHHAQMIAEKRFVEGRLDEGKAAYLAIVMATPPEKRLAAVVQFRNAVLKYTNSPADYAEVQRAYISLMPPGPSDAKAIEQAKLGYVLLRAGQQQLAAAEFKKALAHDSSDPAFYVRMGDILRRGLGEPSTAIRFYERALQLDPGNVAADARLAVARQALAPGNPGRVPEVVLTGPPPVATQPGALGEAGALDRASLGADGKIDPKMAAQAARVAFDAGMAKSGGTATPVVLGGLPPAAAPPSAPSERVQKDPKWQALKAIEEKLESRVAEVDQALADSERKLDAAPPAEKAKVQVEVVKQRDQVTKVRAELQMAKVQTESYRLSVDEEPISPPPAETQGAPISIPSPAATK